MSETTTMTDEELAAIEVRFDDGTEDAADVAALGHRLCAALRAANARAEKAEADNEKNLRASFKAVRVLSERLGPLGEEEPKAVVEHRDAYRKALEEADAKLRAWSDAKSGTAVETQAACEAWAIVTKALAVTT